MQPPTAWPRPDRPEEIPPPSSKPTLAEWTVLGLLVFAVVLWLTGCASQTRGQEVRQESTIERTAVRGTIGLPVPATASAAAAVLPSPVDLLIERRSDTEGQMQSQARTAVDGAEIGRQVGQAAAAAVNVAVSQALPGVVATLRPAGPGQDWTAIGGGLLAAIAGGATAYGAVQRRRAAEHKADADEGWNRALGGKDGDA